MSGINYPLLLASIVFLLLLLNMTITDTHLPSKIISEHLEGNSCISFISEAHTQAQHSAGHIIGLQKNAC